MRKTLPARKAAAAPTLDEIIAEIEKETGPEGLTTREIMEASGRRSRWVTTHLFDAGLMEFVGHRRIRFRDGRLGSVPVYRVRKKREEKEYD